jgi:hypothetical protein
MQVPGTGFPESTICLVPAAACCLLAAAAASGMLSVRTWFDLQAMFEVAVIHQDFPDEESSCSKQ